MDVAWFLVLSAFIFCIGGAGVLTKRNPLVILLCLELMLNAANLALVAFSRMWGNGDGQVFPLGGMLVVGLGWRWLPGRSAGWVGTAAIGASFVCSLGALVSLLGRDPDQ